MSDEWRSWIKKSLAVAIIEIRAEKTSKEPGWWGESSVKEDLHWGEKRQDLGKSNGENRKSRKERSTLNCHE